MKMLTLQMHVGGQVFLLLGFKALVEGERGGGEHVMVTIWIVTSIYSWWKLQYFMQFKCNIHEINKKGFRYYNYEKGLETIFKFSTWMWNNCFFSKPTLVVKIIIYGILPINTSNFFGKFYGLWTSNIMKLLIIFIFLLFSNNAINLYNDVLWHYLIEKCSQLLDLLRTDDQLEQ
jgi:hypothetical protein